MISAMAIVEVAVLTAITIMIITIVIISITETTSIGMKTERLLSKKMNICMKPMDILKLQPRLL